MIRKVRLASLPAGLQFPEELRDRIGYDASRHCLTFDGFMSKATFDRLEALHTDLEYRRALEQLFRIAVLEDEEPRRGAIWVAAGLTVVLMASAVGLFQWYSG